MEQAGIPVGIIGFNGVMGLDLMGPADAFAAANELAAADGQPGKCYEVSIIGLDAAPFTASAGVTMLPHCALETAPALDTLIIPGGVGGRTPETMARLVPWLKDRAPAIRRVVSVCTGVYPLAEAGLLDRRRVTTHWSHARAVARRYPRLRVDGNAIFIQDGPFYTSAGVTAGIDLSLALIEADFGARLALSVARELVVYLKRPGGQEQYSEPLRFQIASTDRFGELAAWIASHLNHDLSVETLAARACLSPRQFSRRFKTSIGFTPADFVEEMRLDAARQRLAQRAGTIETIAASVGFKSADVFRRVFERRLGVTPSHYRDGFPEEEGLRLAS